MEAETTVQNELKAQNKKLLIRIIGLIMFNTALFPLLIKSTKSFPETFLAGLSANLIGFSIIGFMLGAIVALFPYKGLRYGKKYLRASLLTIFTIQSINAVGLALVGIMTLLGWR